MRMEGEHRRRQLKVLGGFGQALEHGLMAAMDAVEVTDGERHMIRGAGGKAAGYVHAGRAGAMAGRP
jgi:hypothetical protein